MGTQLVRVEFPPARMRVVVELNFRVALETDWDGVFDIVTTTTTAWVDMVQLDLHPAESVTDAAPAVTGSQDLICFRTIEGHLFIPAQQALDCRSRVKYFRRVPRAACPPMQATRDWSRDETATDRSRRSQLPYRFPMQYNRLSVRSRICPPCTAGEALVRVSSSAKVLWASSSNVGFAATTNV